MNNVIILINGDPSLAEMLKERGEYSVHCFSDVSQALAFAETEAFAEAEAFGAAETAETSEPSEIVIGGLRVNSLTHKCYLDNEEIKLTPLEFRILWYLCNQRGRVVPGKELFEAVWGEKYLDSAGTVMPHIARLRKKLREPPKAPRYLKTVWGVGYTVDSNE